MRSWTRKSNALRHPATNSNSIICSLSKFWDPTLQCPAPVVSLLVLCLDSPSKLASLFSPPKVKGLGSPRHYRAVYPPSTGNAIYNHVSTFQNFWHSTRTPVIHEESSEARNTAARAMSSGIPNPRNGCRLIMCSCVSSSLNTSLVIWDEVPA
jgi:hypothetical protein